jgi:hypothetical protein
VPLARLVRCEGLRLAAIPGSGCQVRPGAGCAAVFVVAGVPFAAGSVSGLMRQAFITASSLARCRPRPGGGPSVSKSAAIVAWTASHTAGSCHRTTPIRSVIKQGERVHGSIQPGVQEAIETAEEWNDLAVLPRRSGVGPTLQLALGHLGVVRIDTECVVTLLVPESRGAGEGRTFTFLESLETIQSKITIDVVTWHLDWPGRTRRNASMEAFSPARAGGRRSGGGTGDDLAVSSKRSGGGLLMPACPHAPSAAGPGRTRLLKRAASSVSI